jgi:hypothetical protein
MKSLLYVLTIALLSFGLFTNSAVAQTPAGGSQGVTPQQTGPGAGRDITHAISPTTTRFEGLTSGGTQTSGTRWRKIGDEWYRSGTWVKEGHNVESYSDDGTHHFTDRGAGNFSNTTGPTTDHTGSSGTTWTAV